MSEKSSLIKIIKEKYRNEKLVWTDTAAPLPHDVQCAVEYLYVYLFQPNCSVAEMGEKCSLESNNFSIRFKYYLEMTPVSYIRYHRIELAKRLLSEERLQYLQISDIGFAVGYIRPSTFSTTFSRQEGTPPSRWRSEEVKM